MTINDAIEVLRKHNEWRRYSGEIDKSPEMTDPATLGKAIDTVVEHFADESKDERIYNEIMEFFRMNEKRCIVDNSYTKWIAWLEKQKEQKPTAEEVLVKAGLKPFKDGNQWCILAGDNIQEGICGFGDTIDDALYDFLMDVLNMQKEQKPTINIKHLKSYMLQYLQDAANRKDDSEIEADTDKWAKKIIELIGIEDSADGKELLYVSNKSYDIGFRDGVASVKPAEWSEEDKVNLKRAINICVNDFGEESKTAQFLKSLPERFNLQPKQEWSEEDEKKMIFLERLIEHNVPDGQYGWADGRNGGFVTKLEAISMLKSLRPQPKVEWSEEDKKMIERLITRLNRITYNTITNGTSLNITFFDEIEWLKSLRPQSHWKPSEEQMEVLLNAEGLVRANNYPENAKILASLYKQLKKL